MIKLELSTEPRWLDIGRGVRLQVLPAISPIASQVWTEMGEAGIFSEDPDVDSGVLEAKAWARRVIIDWEGVGDIDGNPIDPAPEAIDALLDIPWVYLAFRTLYVAPQFALESEKNGLSPSPSGSSAEAENTATPAPGPARNAPAR